MLVAVAIVPGSPSLVPALTGPAVPELTDLRAAARDAVMRLAAAAPTRWIALSAADAHDPIGVGETGFRRGDLPVDGTYAGFGVDERVRLVPGEAPANADDSMPTTMLAAAWLRTRHAPAATADPVLLDAAITGPRLAAAADAVTAMVDRTEPVGLLVVADGSTGLTSKAPAGLVDGAEIVQGRLDAAIAAADLDAVDALDPAECTRVHLDGRAVVQVAARVWRAGVVTAPVGESLWTGAPFGVGGHVAWWRRDADVTDG